MSYQTEPSFDERSTHYTYDEKQIKLQSDLSTTTSKNKKTFLKKISKINNVIGNDKLEADIEYCSTVKINNPFIENIDALNIKSSSSELEDDLNFDNLPNSVYNSLNNDVVIEITDEELNQNNTENEENSESSLNSSLNRKRERDEDKKIFARRDNGIKEVNRFFFNHYLKKLIIIFENKCGFIKDVKSFPEKFIFNVYANKNNHLLDYTFEQLLEDENLYKDKDPKNYYSVNKKVLDELNKEIYKDAMKKSGCDKILKMTFRNLFENFLKSDIYKKHIDDLIKKNKKVKAKRFKHFAETFLPKNK